eukprot:CAMPEP_0182574420 /NCGR_PEP_ID=MMETSP1324-20130603/25013_1 /TAXON_ID=236786 /ORGANISM="Florenciella sp., Strain RCC1587" /LENGTH=121 /DNA_ID=CAMNT_0024789781 /DNA_START=66 /DNA_END=427 /DNA_ORIENTATION=-
MSCVGRVNDWARPIADERSRCGSGGEEVSHSERGKGGHQRGTAAHGMGWYPSHKTDKRVDPYSEGQRNTCSTKPRNGPPQFRGLVQEGFYGAAAQKPRPGPLRGRDYDQRDTRVAEVNQNS